MFICTFWRHRRPWTFAGTVTDNIVPLYISAWNGAQWCYLSVARLLRCGNRVGICPVTWVAAVAVQGATDVAANDTVRRGMESDGAAGTKRKPLKRPFQRNRFCVIWICMDLVMLVLVFAPFLTLFLCGAVAVRPLGPVRPNGPHTIPMGLFPWSR